ncbi:hypothetical protein AAW14_21895 [Streptomyces hygroscopicus]|uniref:DUF5944 family protein n=1 Tax=Streptomyces hygroscopicus TaxID=1912 RepID=UPI00223F7BDB|nr:DUF5944 family protein [Streptomyces hygroscopicus]MCW7944588.1 hypothetical protein [Streptomyces hygroscopicus]
MAPSFVACPSMSVVRNDDYTDNTDISAAFARHVVSGQVPPDISPLHCSVETAVVGTGVRLSFASRVEKLSEPAAVTHKFYFVDREEARESVRLMTPESPEVLTDLLVLFDEDQERDYCHVSVFDGENRMLATHSVVFDRRGRHTSYPLTPKFVSPLRLGRAEFRETRDERGRRVGRFSFDLKDLMAPQPVSVSWEAVGLVHRTDLVCTPDQPVVIHDMPLEDNGRLAPADWVVIATDDQERLVAQTMVTLIPAAAVEAARP